MSSRRCSWSARAAQSAACGTPTAKYGLCSHRRSASGAAMTRMTANEIRQPSAQQAARPGLGGQPALQHEPRPRHRPAVRQVPATVHRPAWQCYAAGLRRAAVGGEVLCWRPLTFMLKSLCLSLLQRWNAERQPRSPSVLVLLDQLLVSREFHRAGRAEPRTKGLFSFRQLDIPLS